MLILSFRCLFSPRILISKLKKNESGDTVFSNRNAGLLPSQYPDEELQAEKRDFIRMEKEHIFVREKECELIGGSDAKLQPHWLKKVKELPHLREYEATAIYIDPAPPPTSAAIERNRIDSDYEVLMVVGRVKDNIYCIDYRMNRGHTPEWTKETLHSLIQLYNPLRISCESVAYQATLLNLLETDMANRRLI